MSLHVAVHKDIGEYTEKVVGKLSLRTLACTVAGLAVSVAVAALCHFAFGIEAADASLPVMCASMPFWLLGFWRPHGMRAEEFLPLLIEHRLGQEALLYRPSYLLEGMGRANLAERQTRKYTRRSRRKGAELREPVSETQEGR